MPKLSNKPLLHTQQMLKVMKYVLGKKGENTEASNAFLKSIGYTSPANLYKIKNGTSNFDIRSIYLAIKVYGVDPRFFFDEKAPMFSNYKKASAADLIREVLLLIEKK